MKRYFPSFQTMDSVFFGLWFPAIAFAIWIVLACVTWILPFHPPWTSFIHHYAVPFFLLGILLQLMMCIFHQQILLMKSFSDHTLSNLTMKHFFQHAGRIFLWSIPWYIGFTGYLFFFSQPYSHYEFIFSPGLSTKVILAILLGLFLLLGSVYWIGISLLFRQENGQIWFNPFRIWTKAIALFFSHFPLWGWCYFICVLAGGVLFAANWFCWFLVSKIQIDPSLFWEWFYPDHWLLNVMIAGIGFISVYITFVTFVSFASAESIQDLSERLIVES